MGNCLSSNLTFIIHFSFQLNIGETSQDPPELPAVLKYPLNFTFSQFHPVNFQLLSIWTHPYKLGHKIFQKDQNTPNFYFKKNKKKNLEDEILYKSHRLKFTI
jgi:hypothetical protein